MVAFCLMVVCRDLSNGWVVHNTTKRATALAHRWPTGIDAAANGNACGNGSSPVRKNLWNRHLGLNAPLLSGMGVGVAVYLLLRL